MPMASPPSSSRIRRSASAQRSGLRLTQATFEQAARYNLEMRAPYLVVTNGPATYCCELDFEEQRFHYLQELPDLLKA